MTPPIYKPKKGHLEGVPQPQVLGASSPILTMVINHVLRWSSSSCSTQLRIEGFSGSIRDSPNPVMQKQILGRDANFNAAGDLAAEILREKMEVVPPISLTFELVVGIVWKSSPVENTIFGRLHFQRCMFFVDNATSCWN